MIWNYTNKTELKCNQVTQNSDKELRKKSENHIAHVDVDETSKMLRYVVLCYAVLCCVMLYFVMLCCAMLLC